MKIQPYTISYSALVDYKNCPHYFKLAKIDKIKVFENNFKTIHGKLLHAGVQNILSKISTPEEEIALFKRKWTKFCRLYKKFIPKEKFKEIKNIGLSTVKIFEEIIPFTENLFGKFKVLFVEYKIFSDLTNHPQKFIGFIDIVLETEDGKIKIIDFKTCDSVFYFKKYKDKYKDYQLTLYKNFYSKIFNIPEENIETYFLLLERNPKSRTLISSEKIGSSRIKVKNALLWMDKSLTNINNKVFIKKREHCDAYNKKCVFWNTSRCPLNS